MKANSSILHVDRLNVRYGEYWVLQDLSFEVARGDFVCVIGPNGAGKSTLLKTIVGLVPIQAGTIQSEARRIGYVPQQLQIDRALPLRVDEFLLLKLSQRWPWRKSAPNRRSVQAKLAEIGAAHLLERQLGRLSGGEFQRVLIAYALLDDPDLLLLDEPLTGLDVRGGFSFDGLLHHLHEHRGITILMVSHDLHLVEHVSDEVLCINRSVCCAGKPSEILQPENLAKAYGHFPELVREERHQAFIPLGKIK